MSERTQFFAALLLAICARDAVIAQDTGRVPTKAAGITPELDVSAKTPRRVSTDASKLRSRGTRILFITSKDCDRCDQELARLQKPGGDFEAMQSRGWKIGESPDSHIQIVDRDEVPELVNLLKVREYPAVACISQGEIIRSFTSGCSTPLDSWTFGWLIKGENERPQPMIPESIRVASSGSYPLRGNHWTVDGDPSPSKETVVAHLRGAYHGQSIAGNYAIESWSYEEVRSLHDALHEREGVGAYAASSYAPPAANRSLDSFSGNRKVMGR